MTKVILYTVAAVLGVLYALFPKWFLSKKAPGGRVTDSAVKTARMSGIVVAVVGAVLAVTTLARM